MKPMLVYSYSVILTLFLATFLNGCTVATRSPVQSNASALPIDRLAMITPAVTGTTTITTALIPSETYFPTAAESPAATATALPTIPAHERQAYVIDLITNNRGCQLPCWWGIQPGKTTWEEARNFLLSFGANIRTLRDDVYSVTYKNLPQNISDGAVGAGISVNEGIVQIIETDVYYPLENVLQVYGQPDEVWIYTDRGIDPKARFILALYYGEKGFVAVYHGTAEKESILQVCPNAIGEDEAIWVFWAPSLRLSFENVGQMALLFTGPSDNRFHRIENVTNVNAQQFFDRYRNKGKFSDYLEVLIDEQR